MHLIPKIFIQGSIVLSMICIGLSMAVAQTASLSGKVVEAETGEPVAFANVFISNTTKGTISALDGNFTLHGIPLGAVNLVISYVGYETLQFSFDLNENTTLTNPLVLNPDNRKLVEVEIAGKKDRRWARRLVQFKEAFFGNSEFAMQCELVNPWVLEFSEEKGNKKSFTAMAQLPLEIRNKALGYHVTYHLKFFSSTSSSVFFTGSIRFKEMEAETPLQKETWIRNREQAYLGSLRHLFKSILFNNILEGQLMEEGFMIYRDKPGYENYYIRSANFSKENGTSVEPLPLEGIVTPSYRTGLYRIELSGRIEVHYNRVNGEPQNVIYDDLPFEVSWIELKGNFVDVTKDGVEQRTDQLVISGAMLEGRLARMLPHDYTPSYQQY